MSFLAYKRLFCSLLIAGMLLLIGTGVVAKLYRSATGVEKRATATVSLLSVAAAFSVNVTCGMAHKRMFARGGTVSIKEEGITLFSVSVVLNLGLAVLSIFAAVRIWSGVVPVFA